MAAKILELAKSLLTVRPQDDPFIGEMKGRFRHGKRSFRHGFFRYFADSLECEASPGVLETVVMTLSEQVGSKKKLLNLGGGSGQVSEIFRAAGFDVCNVDISLAREDGRDKRFDLNGDGLPPFERGSFDAVVCQEVIEHLENPWKLFRTAKEMMRDDGIFILTTPNVLSWQSRWLFLRRGYFQWFTPECFSYHINPLPRWEIGLIGERVGFKMEGVKGNGDYYFSSSAGNERKTINRNEQLIFLFRK